MLELSYVSWGALDHPARAGAICGGTFQQKRHRSSRCLCLPSRLGLGVQDRFAHLFVDRIGRAGVDAQRLTQIVQVLCLGFAVEVQAD